MVSVVWGGGSDGDGGCSACFCGVGSVMVCSQDSAMLTDNNLTTIIFIVHQKKVNILRGSR